MNFEKQPVESLYNESDVEQKFVYPLLIADHPSGLGFSDNSVRTKANIRRFTIGKGSDTKSYIPDYIIVEGGVPLVIVEGKRPGSDVEEAFREARLYAAEMNALFPKNVNPVFAIIATDAVRTLVGSPDQATPIIDMCYDDIDIYSEKLRTMIEYCGRPASLAQYTQIVKIIRPTYLWKPRRMVGGSAIQREEVNLNTFGATISADFALIFNPLTHADRANIAKNGYISSKRRERYIQPIDRVIRAAAPPSETRAKSIDDTSNPKEIYKVLRDRRPLENKIMLLIGSAGSGKTTFVDYLQETALPADIRNRTLWIRVNGNNINIARDEIYNSLRKEIISVCKLMHSNIDFEDLETIKLIHSVEVNAYRKGIGRLFEKDKSAYDSRLADVLTENENNLHTKATNYVRYLSNGGDKLVVYVLDNSDKRLKADQLMMFEAAQWLQKEFRGLVVLPLREETYDNHRSEPPLDTALKDLVFRIEPPLFQKVLQSRVQLALKSIQGKGQKSLRYSLPNGMHVEYAASDQAFYLASIMKSIFEHDHHVRHLIVGLSGRNIRRALEIFLDFCTSGHIGEDEFLKIKQSEGQYVLPLSLVTTILLRVNQRFYSSSHAYLKNICSVSERDEKLHYFSRLVLLRLLEIERSSTGPERLKGYMHVSLLRNKAFLYGIRA